jgi:hypothetical protein
LRTADRGALTVSFEQHLAVQHVHQFVVQQHGAAGAGCHAPHHHVVGPLRAPRGGIDLGGAGGSGGHRIAIHAAETAAALQIALDHGGDVQSPVGRHGARERHDCNRHRIGDAAGDVDLELRMGGKRDRGEQQQQAGKTCVVWHLLHGFHQLSGRNVTTRLRSNKAGSGGCGSGDAR